MYPSPLKYQLGLAWLCVLVAGLLAGSWARDHARRIRLADLEIDARRCAIALDPVAVSSLAGTHEDLESDAYRRVKDKLVELRAIHPSIRFLSVFRSASQTGDVIYLADSEPRGSSELSLPGDPFPEASGMPGLQSILRDGRASTEGPIGDSFGVFVTGYAAIGEPRSVGTGLVREVLALDVSASAWNLDLLDAGVKLAVYTWLLLGVPVAAFTWRLRQARRDALIDSLSEAVQQSSSGILMVSPQGRIERVNEGLCAQLGYPPGELVGRFCRDFIPEGLSPERIDDLLRTTGNGDSWEGEWQHRRKSGQAYPAQAVVSPVRSRRGGLLGYLAVITDMAATQHHHEELRVAKELAEAADKAKGEFLATMSHEVRTPLNGIVGFTNLLLETPLSPDQRECVQTIRTSGEALVQLTGDILDFSRIASGGLHLESSICDIRGVVEDVLDLFAARVGEKQVELLHWIEPDVPQQVLLDPGRLRQILVNLVGNGVKFTPAGSVTVSVRALTGKAASIAPFDPYRPDGQWVAELEDGGLTFEFTVRDTGIGIAPGDRPKLFQPFSQLETTNVRRFGGAGLGLVISRKLVTLMGGDIWLESEPGRGSTFHFTVRARPMRAGDVQPQTGDGLTGCTVAITSPEAEVRDELRNVLRGAGAVVQEYGLNDLSGIRADFLVVDLHEDLSAGIQALVTQPGWRREAAFAIVGLGTSSEDRQVLRPAFRMLLNKPLHHRTFVELLTRARAENCEAQPPPKLKPV